MDRWYSQGGNYKKREKEKRKKKKKRHTGK
jgi:hypothetical protein